jgi:hypothetical protein
MLLRQLASAGSGLAGGLVGLRAPGYYHLGQRIRELADQLAQRTDVG